MAEEKKLSPAEQAIKSEEARATNVKKTLESLLIQNVVGSNMVKTSPHLYTGELGFQSANDVYEKSMLSEDVKKVKDQIYKEKTSEGKQLGIFGEPSFPTNYDISLKLVKQLEEVLAIAKLDELEKFAKKSGAKLDFEVPEELKNYSQVELIQKAYNQDTGKIDIKSLSETEQHALGIYQVLSESYKRACALKATQTNYFADLSAQGKKIADLYKKEEPDKK